MIPFPHPPIVALVSSAGGLEATTEILGRLPADFPAALIVLQHQPPHRVSLLPAILQRSTALTVRAAIDGDRLVAGQLLVVPAGKHMIVGSDDCVRLIDNDDYPAPRPSADLLLATLATAVGPRAIAVVLSGRGHDGSLGVQAVHLCGGRVLVQSKESAAHYGMPEAAVHSNSPTPPMSLRGIAEELVTLTADGRFERQVAGG